MTTVGYGDLYPVTVLGRAIAAVLMIGGISLIGVVTGSLASWIVQRVAEADAGHHLGHHLVPAREITELRREISALAEELRQARSELASAR